MTDNETPIRQGHPLGLVTLFFTEMWERLSYYGMRALLVLYLVDQVEKGRGGMGLDDQTANAIYGLYTAFVYLASLPGGWIADRILGAQRCVWYGGMIIAAGHFTLAIPRHEAFFMGLMMIVAGTGLLKPNISVIVGQLYPEGGARRDAGFTIFYMGINLGAFLGPLVCSFLGENYNWHYGFAAAGFGMLAGLLQFFFTSRLLGDAGRSPTSLIPSEKGRPLILGVSGLLVITCLLAVPLLSSLQVHVNPVPVAKFAKYFIVSIAAIYLIGIGVFGKLNPAEFKQLAVLYILFFACSMFWAGFEQAGSSLNLFAERYTMRTVAGYEVPTGWFQSLNPVFIIVLSPVMAALWVALASRNRNLSIIGKFAWGLILVGLGFLVMSAASKLVGPERRVLPTWLITTYFLHTVGELCLSPVGLSAVSKLAPKRFVSQLMGLWFVATSFGNLLAGLMAGKITEDVAQMPGGFLYIATVSLGLGFTLLVAAPIVTRWVGRVE